MRRHATHNTQHATTKELVRALLAWFSANARDLPWRRTGDPYAIWISEIMLQQTQVVTVIPYWQRWMRELPTVRAAAKARPAKLRKLWEGLGYYTRVQNLQRAVRQIVEQHGGKFPKDFEGIFALPGIGRYTAGAIASIAFNEPKPLLDGNVTRVLTRLFAIRSNPRERKANARLWQLAEAMVVEASRSTQHATPNKRRESSILNPAFKIARFTAGPCSALNQSLMELGAVICTPRNPHCDECPLAKFCAGRRFGLAEKLPNNGKRARSEARHIAAFLVSRRGRILARQRPAGGINAHFWELPNVELQDQRQNLARCARKTLGIEPHMAKPLCVVSHNITRYRIRVEVFTGELLRPLPDARWLLPADLRSKAFTGLDRKILRRLRLA
jgi:A/G-specific adenine glycosylase